MRLALMLEPQEGLSYDDLLAVARRVEAAGLDGLYRSDHYTSVAGREGLPSTDAWATLAGLARETERITLGTLVSPATFRPAGNLAKVVATVAGMAGTTPEGASRVHLGMGTGWLEVEHRQFGFPFEDMGTRFDRLEEHLAAVRGLFDPDRDPYSQSGAHVTLEGNAFRPVPDPRPRVIVGGRGLKRTPALAARFADELNGVYLSREECAEQRAALDRACEDADRDPAAVGYTLMTGCLVGADRADFEDRARALQRVRGDERDVDAFVADLPGSWVTGPAERAAETIGRLGEVGVQKVMLQHQMPAEDLAMVDVIGADLLSRVGATA